MSMDTSGGAETSSTAGTSGVNPQHTEDAKHAPGNGLTRSTSSGSVSAEEIVKWLKFEDPQTGRFYYQNQETHEITWKDPGDSASSSDEDDSDGVVEEQEEDVKDNPTSAQAQASSSPPRSADSTPTTDDAADDDDDDDAERWQQFTDNQGRAYYLNTKTGQTQWEDPKDNGDSDSDSDSDSTGDDTDDEDWDAADTTGPSSGVNASGTTIDRDMFHNLSTNGRPSQLGAVALDAAARSDMSALVGGSDSDELEEQVTGNGGTNGSVSTHGPRLITPQATNELLAMGMQATFGASASAAGAAVPAELEDEDLGEFLQGSDEDIDHDDVERKAGDRASAAARLLATPTLWLSSNSTQQWSAEQCGADHSPGGTVISQFVLYKLLLEASQAGSDSVFVLDTRPEAAFKSQHIRTARLWPKRSTYKSLRLDYAELHSDLSSFISNIGSNPNACVVVCGDSKTAASSSSSSSSSPSSSSSLDFAPSAETESVLSDLKDKVDAGRLLWLDCSVATWLARFGGLACSVKAAHPVKGHKCRKLTPPTPQLVLAPNVVFCLPQDLQDDRGPAVMKGLGVTRLYLMSYKLPHPERYDWLAVTNVDLSDGFGSKTTLRNKMGPVVNSLDRAIMGRSTDVVALCGESGLSVCVALVAAFLLKHTPWLLSDCLKFLQERVGDFELSGEYLLQLGEIEADWRSSPSFSTLLESDASLRNRVEAAKRARSLARLPSPRLSRTRSLDMFNYELQHDVAARNGKRNSLLRNFQPSDARLVVHIGGLDPSEQIRLRAITAEQLAQFLNISSDRIVAEELFSPHSKRSHSTTDRNSSGSSKSSKPPQQAYSPTSSASGVSKSPSTRSVHFDSETLELEQTKHQQAVDDLKKENKRLQQRLASLERDVAMGISAPAAAPSSASSSSSSSPPADTTAVAEEIMALLNTLGPVIDTVDGVADTTKDLRKKWDVHGAEIQSECEFLKQRVEDQQREVDRALVEQKKTEEALEQARRRLEEAERGSASVQEEIQILRTAKENQERACAKARETSQQLAAELMESRAQAAEAETLRAQADKMRNELAEVRTARDALRQQVSDLHSKLQREERKRKEAQAVEQLDKADATELATAVSRNQELEAMLEQSVLNFNEIERKLQQVQAREQEVQAQCALLEQTKKLWEKRESELKNKVADLEIKQLINRADRVSTKVAAVEQPLDSSLDESSSLLSPPRADSKDNSFSSSVFSASPQRSPVRGSVLYRQYGNGGQSAGATASGLNGFAVAAFVLVALLAVSFLLGSDSSDDWATLYE